MKLLTLLRHGKSEWETGAENDFDEHFYYDSDGRLYLWEHDAYGDENDIEERFYYDSQGRLIDWEQDRYGADDAQEHYSYDC